MRKVLVASDHAGVEMKAAVIGALIADGVDAEDLGTTADAACDYPDQAAEVATRVSAGIADLGVLICGTGIGMSMAANKVSGIRAAAVSDPVSAMLAREHNDANIVCVGARIIGIETALAITRAFVGAAFDGGERHRRRVSKIAALEAGWRTADREGAA